MSVVKPPLVELSLQDLIEAEGGYAGAVDRLARAGMLTKEDLIDILHRDLDEAIRDLEAARKHHRNSDEELMSSNIVSFMRARGYDAIPDPTDGGHVDIYIRSTRLNVRWAAEAKIHRGTYEHSVEGVKQLVTRYASGFDSHGGFFLYVKTSNAAEVTARFRDCVMANADCKTLRFVDGSVVFRYISVHDHDAGIEYCVRNHIVLMHFDPRDKSAKASAARRTAKLVANASPVPSDRDQDESSGFNVEVPTVSDTEDQ